MTPTMPNLPANPFAALAGNPAAALQALTAALYQILAGQSVAEVAFENQILRFSKSNVDALRSEIRRLERIVTPKFATVRAGPHARWTGARQGFIGF